MAPALSLMVQTVRHAGSYSDTQTEPYSRTFTTEPGGLRVAGPDDPAFFPAARKNSDKFINISNLCKVMQEDENERGEYHTLDSKIWELLEINKKTDSRGRINTGSESYYNVDVRVFVSDIDQEPEKCKSFLLLPKTIFTEVRKSRVKTQAGEPLKVQKNGDIWTTQKEKYVKIFVRK